MDTKQFIRQWFLPPGFRKLLTNAPPSVKALWGGQPPKPLEEPIVLSPDGPTAAELHDLLTAAYGEVVWVPVEKIRIWGRGLTTEQNQYVRYFADGLESLRRFYELHQPQDLIQAMFLHHESFGRTPVEYPSVRNPWSFETEYQGEGPLGAEHGWQEYGPITDSKLRFEAQRLDTIRTAVLKQGFLMFPDRQWDFIRLGKILLNDVGDGAPDFVVRVFGGFHRASLLTAMGWRFIPMIPEPTFPIREVRLTQAENWPGVLDGTFSIDQARAYFLAHFRDPHEVLIPEW